MASSPITPSDEAPHYDLSSSSSSEDGENDKLCNLIMQREATSCFDGGGHIFTPEGTLDELLTPDVIKKELMRCARDPQKAERDINVLVTYIEQKAKKLFAIVVRQIKFDKPHYLNKTMHLFKHGPNGGLSDRNFPLPRPADGEKHILTLFNPPPGKGKMIWTERNIGEFCRYQWAVQVSVFRVATKTSFSLDIPRGPCLPFIEKDESTRQSGGFGEVVKCRIHRKHLINEENPVS